MHHQIRGDATQRNQPSTQTTAVAAHPGLASLHLAALEAHFADVDDRRLQRTARQQSAGRRAVVQRRGGGLDGSSGGSGAGRRCGGRGGGGGRSFASLGGRGWLSRRLLRTRSEAGAMVSVLNC